MNKETRTFIFGIIVFVLFQACALASFPKEFLSLETVLWIVSIGLSSYGLTKILKTID